MGPVFATSDYSKAFTRIRDAVAALPVDSAVLDGEAIVMRSAHRCDFEALRSRQGQAGAILVAYDIMEVDGRDVRRISKGFLFEMLFAAHFYALTSTTSTSACQCSGLPPRS